MAYQKKALATKPESLNLIQGTYTKVEGEKWLHKAVLWPPHACNSSRTCMCVHKCDIYATHSYTQNNNFWKKQKKEKKRTWVSLIPAFLRWKQDCLKFEPRLAYTVGSRVDDRSRSCCYFFHKLIWCNMKSNFGFYFIFFINDTVELPECTIYHAYLFCRDIYIQFLFYDNQPISLIFKK